MRCLLANTLVCVFIVLGSMKADGVKIYGVGDKDIKIILTEHNKVRHQIERGDFPGLPRGENFKYLKYDKKLAAEAQRIANTCTFKHVPVYDRRWPEPRGVGQNIYIYGSSSYSGSPNWTRAIDDWKSESKKYSYRPCDGSSVTGHFTQIIWADTELIGCGYSHYQAGSGMKQMLLVCNYGPGYTYCFPTFLLERELAGKYLADPVIE